MNVISIIGVSRGNEYSPNHVDNDAAIFNKVVEELGQWPCQIKLVPTNAPYFDGAKLLIAADCSAYA